MPVTPFHYPIAKILHQLGGKINLSLPALIVGSMVPDLEVPFISLLSQTQDRLILHSLIGGLTLGTAIAVFLTVLVYAPLVGAFFPVNKERLKQKCAFSGVVVFSCLVGVLSHVLLDVANHTYNPLFWPLLSAAETPSPIVPLLGGSGIASLIVHGSMGILFVGICIVNRESLWEHLLAGNKNEQTPQS
jgi:membrane-bound metal-dependent hydrolase YbcI (DUF457 family)